ncbi:nitroreductase family deazaflavin-dependent oxidoreductase [Pedococcus sp. KACC 23699]|uniref:Nitroreductase family deazaflavin-dependent oxidoreductase n=1 Tax=Pedococcus sp. KACC 23699 TaxID=3149228 RepID=A0AAU7JXD6_9MICO
MNTVMRTLMRTANKAAVAIYKVTGGRLGGKASGGVPVLLLTVTGRRTGQPRTTPVGYFEHEGGYLVVGSAGGMPQDPQWFRNLRATSRAEVQVGRQVSAVTVREVTGAERDAAWKDVVVARCPPFAKYEVKTSRTIPLALLTPVH